jgi:hypothetical protein
MLGKTGAEDLCGRESAQKEEMDLGRETVIYMTHDALVFFTAVDKFHCKSQTFPKSMHYDPYRL